MKEVLSITSLRALIILYKLPPSPRIRFPLHKLTPTTRLVFHPTRTPRAAFRVTQTQKDVRLDYRFLERGMDGGNTFGKRKLFVLFFS